MANHIWPLLILVLIMLAPVESDHLSSLAAIKATSNSTNATSNSTIASWTSLSSSITAAAGKAVTLTLSTPFDMTGFQDGSAIDIDTAKTAITIVGNGAVFDAGGKDRLFVLHWGVTLVMSHVTLQNGGGSGHGGAIHVDGTATLSNCIFSGNIAQEEGYGGAIDVYGTVTLSNCIFSGNTAQGTGGYAGGALFFTSNSNGLLKNCSLLGTVSPNKNDIARYDTSANIIFACADGEVGTPVRMSGTENTKLPVPTCTTPPSPPLLAN